MRKFKGLELCVFAYRDQIKCDTDLLCLYMHWYLIQNDYQCIVDGNKTERLPNDWNSSNTEYNIDYTKAEQGYALKLIVVEDSLIINLMKKSSERTANVTCNIRDHVLNYKNEYQSLYINLQDLHENIQKEFELLNKEENNKVNKLPDTSTSSSFDKDPLRVYREDRRMNQPTGSPFSYGRRDLDPFGGMDPLCTGGGMIFDPFRNSSRPLIPPNLPPGAVPPGARFDPFGPPCPDNMGGGSSRVGPNPNHLKPPGFDDMFM